MSLGLEELQKWFDGLHYSWELFESVETGQILPGVCSIENCPHCSVSGQAPPMLRMRVGLHMGRPTQAIMAEGHFLRIRAARPEFAVAYLKKLDPQYPDTCLYLGGLTGQQPMWMPSPPAPVFSQSGLGWYQTINPQNQYATSAGWANQASTMPQNLSVYTGPGWQHITNNGSAPITLYPSGQVLYPGQITTVPTP